MSALISTSKFCESYNGNAYTYGYSTTVFPTSSLNFLTVNFYDSYLFNQNDQAFFYTPNELTGQPATNFNRTMGMPTGNLIKVMGSNSYWVKTISYYDDKGRVIQSISDHGRLGSDRTTSTYDFAGKVLRTKSTHFDNRLSWTNIVNVTVKKDRISSGAAGNWGDAHAVSTTSLPANSDGWVEATYHPCPFVAFGFHTEQNSGGSYSMAYGILIRWDGVFIRNASFWTPTLNDGDKIRLERVGNSMVYKINGVSVYTETNVSLGELFVNTSLTGTDPVLYQPRSSFTAKIDSITRRFEYDHAGRLLNTYHKVQNGTEVLLARNEYNALGQLIDKKLHSTNSGTNFKQSIDYRYNIRGWLTKINESNVQDAGNLAADGSGVLADLFGMELGYNAGIGTTNNNLYNGNISAMKWSKKLSLGMVKDVAYNYDYDPLNRMTAATYKKDSLSWVSSNNAFSESGYSYDMNGNITGLTRKGANGSSGTAMDVLTYDYGTTTSNKLLNVSDAGNKTKGFVEPTSTSGNDYDYDANGNMIRDNNKKITGIYYNHLNLPGYITKDNGDALVYTYDATGRKLAQEVFNSSWVSQKVTDYSGEYFYENDTLKFINHEEGRIVMEGGTPEYQYHLKDHLGNVRLTFTTKSNAVAESAGYEAANVTVEQLKFLRYGNAKRVNSFLFDHTHLINGGPPEVTYSNNFSSNYDDYITGGTMTLSLEGGRLKAVGSAAYSATYRFFNTTQGHRYKFTFDIDFTGDPIAAMGKDFSAEGIITSQSLVSSGTYTLEFTALSGSTAILFFNGATGHNFYLDNIILEDQSPAGTGSYSERLNGSANEKYGLAKSLSVMPGDSIKMEVYAKYLDPNSSNWTGALSALVSAVASGTSGVVIDGAGYGTSTADFPTGYGAFLGQTTNGAPKAYLNWLIFDRNFKFITGGFKQVTTAAKEAGTGVAHERLAPTGGYVAIKEPGYVYVYLSNEETGSQVDVYFDDFKVTHIKSPVIETQDYYPFGLTFNLYQRENSVCNQYQNTGREYQNELNLNWIDFGSRQYMPDIGRWNSVDDVSDMFDDESPFCYAANNPINVIDIGGYFRVSAEFANKYPTLTKMIAHYLPLLKGNATVRNAWMKITDGTAKQFDEMVTYGTGPEIIPTQPENASVWNQNDPYSSEDSNFSPKHPDKVFIAPSSLIDLEQEMSAAKKGKDNQLGAQMFMVSLKIMHEAAHYGVFKHKGADAFWSLEASAVFGDQGAAWEERAYKRFSYLNNKITPMHKEDVFDYYHKNYSDDKMRGMTLSPEFYYNFLMLMGPTPTGEKQRKDPDKEAAKRSGGAH